MNKQQRNDSICEAAMCIWEYALGNRDFMNWLQGEEGQAVARQRVIDYLAEHCECAYILSKEWGYDNCFDWEFVPGYCRLLVGMLGPDGAEEPDYRVAVLIAKELAP